MPAAMIALTVAAPSSTSSKSSSSVRTAGGFGVRRTAMRVAMPSVPSLPTNAPRRSSPAGSGSSAAEHGDLAVGQHDLDGEHVGAGDAVGQAVRAARVVGDVPADRAALLARRVGREVQAVGGDRPAEVEVQHAGLDPCDAIVGVDLEDAVHLRGDDHDRVAERHRAAGEAGARPARDERTPVAAARRARRPAPPPVDVREAHHRGATLA